MANTTYTSRVITLAIREEAYERLARILLHLHNLNLNLVSVIVNGNNSVSITLNNPVPADQLAHLAGGGF